MEYAGICLIGLVYFAVECRSLKIKLKEAQAELSRYQRSPND